MQTHLIPEFSDLTLVNAAAKYDELTELLTESLPAGWMRATDRENNHLVPGIEYRIFEGTDSPTRRAALVFLVPNSSGHVQVANIVPIESGDLGIDGYNAVLTEFADEVVDPAAKKLGIQVEVTPPLIDLRDELGAEPFDKLILFSHAANKHSSHPLDRERWRGFVIAAHRFAKHANSEHVREWLVLDGWERRRADDLEDELIFGLELLADA